MKKVIMLKKKRNDTSQNVFRLLQHFFVLILFFISFHHVELLAQTTPDSAAVADTAKKEPPPAPAETPLKARVAEKTNSVIVLEFVKEKVEHSPDSAFFNILKITNNNGKVVQGKVRFSAPDGWKIISQPETSVNVQPGTTEYVPVRVSLARSAAGGVTYLINATLSADRAIFPDKNQGSVSKACYVTIPRKSKWDVIPLEHTVYFNRYEEYTPLRLKVSNKGNGNEVIKIDLEIGSSLEMYGAIGNRYFTSVMMKPHSDSIVSFPIKYVPVDQSVFWNRDFRSLTVKVAATVDTIGKRTSVTYKYLESIFRNSLPEQVYPLNIEVQLQNLLSDYSPRLFFGADGMLFFKNDHTLDYYMRLNSIALNGYSDAGDFSEKVFWKYSRYHAHYDAGKWEAFAGDISRPGISMIGMGGRGIGGGYIINKKHRLSGSVTTGIYRSLFSGNLQHETVLPKHIALSSALSFVLNDYNKMNTFGAAVKASYPFLPGHRISLLVSGSQTQHLYDNQTFTNPDGSFVTTNNPGASFYGLGTQLDYAMNLKKVKASASAHYISKHFSQYFNGRLWVHGSGQYIINKKYFVTAGANFNQQDPEIYNKGILNPMNKFTYGRYNAEFSDRISSHLILSSGPVFDHTDHQMLKIRNGDSIYTHFSAMSPKWMARANVRNGRYSSFSVFSTMGYTYITRAEDSTMGALPFSTDKPFFTTNTGVNIVQKNWGVNVSYFTGPYNITMQGDYYYFGNQNKSLRVMPYFQRYFYNKRLLVASYNSYYYQTRSNMENIALNCRLSYFFDKGWTLFTDNNMYINSRISSEGIRTYSKTYGLNIGFRKSFDIPQPAVKYYDLRVVCFKDINGNGTMDANEHGLADIVLTVDRDVKTDSITSKPLKLRGQFTPAEMVTDNFGQVMYYTIPQGDYSLNVFPLINLKDLFNIKGQKQRLSISSDTTYYIPFVQTYRVTGHVILKRDEFSSAGNISLANIRVTAMDSAGNSYPSLTSGDGSYTVYAPLAGTYKLTANNVFGDKFMLQEGDYSVVFDGAKDFQLDFIFVETKRQININGGSHTAPPSGTTSPVPPIPPVTPAGGTKDTASKAPENPPAPSETVGVTYRIQVGASSTRIPPSQYANRFKGAKDIKEYVQGGTYKYTSGEFQTWEFEKATEYKDQLIALGYKDAFIAFFRDGKRIK